MYRIVRASIQYYDDFMRDSGVRHQLVIPFTLWVHLDRFQEEKAQRTEAYSNLCDIVDQMKKLFLTSAPQYHHFDMLLGELQALGFNILDMAPAYSTATEKLREQIDLLLQFLACRYPFDEYDNRIGVHDLETNTFVFIQP